MALLLLTGCGTTVRDGVSAGVEDGIAAAIGAFAEALIDATFGTTP